MNLTGPSIKKGSNIKNIIVFLHGYGANGENMLSIGHGLSIDDALLIAPNAPTPYGPIGYMWFDLSSGIDTHNIQKGLSSVRPVLTKYLESLVQEYRVSWDNVCVCGFSQGAMIALDMLAFMINLKNAAAFSGVFCDGAADYAPNLNEKNALLVHGELDSVVDFAFLKTSQDRLKELQINVESVACEGLEHYINARGIKKLDEFLKRNLS